MKAIHFVLATALSVAQLAGASPATAQQDGYSSEMRELREFCYDLIESGNFPGLNFGECMSFNVVPDEGFVPHFCDFLRETEGLGDMTYGECVRSLRRAGS